MTFPIGKRLYLDGDDYVVVGYLDDGRTIELEGRDGKSSRPLESIKQKSNAYWMERIREI